MKRGVSLAALGTMALTLVFVAVTLLVGFSILIKMNSSMAGTNVNLSQMTANVEQGLFDIGTWIPLVVLVAIGGFLIYLIMGSLSGGGGQQ